MAARLEAVLQHPRLWRGGGALHASDVISSGYASVDAQIGGGWPAAGLAEFLAGRAGIGELQLLLPALCARGEAARRVVFLGPPYLPYAPALAAAGLDLASFAVVRAPGRRDALWAAEQVLRSGSCRVLVAWFRNARFEELRRLAVAAEAGRAFAALFRPPQAAREASPAPLRLALEPAGEALSIRILKRRGAPAAAPLLLKVNRPVHAVASPAFPGASSRLARDARRMDVPVHA